uniref:Uncharacterized protein n=1 Tax=Rhizophora mucronata TaxID=61149 RepID=A0A2P2R1V6_RHIMU
MLYRRMVRMKVLLLLLWLLLLLMMMIMGHLVWPLLVLLPNLIARA